MYLCFLALRFIIVSLQKWKKIIWVKIFGTKFLALTSIANHGLSDIYGYIIYPEQIGVGLMVCQQFGGINSICFYVANIFESAGTDGYIS